MTRKLARCGLCVLSALLLGSTVMGQSPEAGAPNATLTDVAQQMQQLSQRLDRLSSQAATRESLALATAGSASRDKSLGDDLEQMRGELATLKDNVAQLHKLYQEQSAEMRTLQSSFKSVTDVLNQQIVEQRQLLDAVAGKDTGGAPYLKMLSVMRQSDQGRQEVRDAVNQSLQTTGILRVDNRMATDQTLAINQQRFQIPANSTRDFTVSIGTVTTELVGFEGPKHLTVTAPTYEQKLVIAPAPTTETFMPVYQAPVILGW